MTDNILLHEKLYSSVSSVIYINTEIKKKLCGLNFSEQMILDILLLTDEFFSLLTDTIFSEKKNILIELECIQNNSNITIKFIIPGYFSKFISEYIDSSEINAESVVNPEFSVIKKNWTYLISEKNNFTSIIFTSKNEKIS